MRSFLNDDRGATAIEYALIASLVCLAIIGGVSALGGTVTSLYNDLAAQF